MCLPSVKKDICKGVVELLLPDVVAAAHVALLKFLQAE